MKANSYGEIVTMGSTFMQPLISIGLPAYNRPELLRQALTSLTQQSYRNLEIIVSDDCSPGEETRKVVQEFAAKDSRVQYIRQEKNLGTVPNHRFVFEKTAGEYFFWASEDDKWNEKYLEIGIRTLLENPGFDAWCCTIRITDDLDRLVGDYVGFSRWTSTSEKWKDIVKYLMEPEIMGKSHVFHSIFRREPLSRTINEYWFNEEWGTDMCFGLAFLTRYNLIATDEVLFDKRVIRPAEDGEYAGPVVIKDPSRYIFPLSESKTYILENYKAARTTPYKYLVFLIMLLRLPIAIRNDYRFMDRVVKPLGKNVARKIKRLLRTMGYPFIYNLFWRKKFGFKHDPMSVDVGWNVSDTSGVIQVPLNIVRAPIATPTGNQLVDIEDTPHYPWIKSLVEGHEDESARAKYRTYTETYWPEENADDALTAVVGLVDSFRSHHDDASITIITLPPELNEDSGFYVQIYDGMHRASIAKALGHCFIQCRLASNQISNNNFISRILGEK